MNVLILSGPNHRFEESAAVINGFLSGQDDLDVTLREDKDVLTSSDMDGFDACVFGTGFTRTVRQPEGPPKREPDLTPEQEEGLFSFVRGGKGLVGIHGTAWWIGGQAVDLIGGHANWHPPGLTFTVNIGDSDHPITQGVEDFEVEDEIYMSAWDPYVQVLATATWSDKQHPMAWVKPYGDGRVFYTTLGHGPGTFERPTMQTLITQGVRWAGQN
ncbi:MAG: ThuA domain-containing protein [bacterium]|nr:ThuA domain-containing protein [bacterium]